MDKLKPCPNCENLKHPDFPCIRCYPLNPVFVRRPASNTNTDTALAAAEARIAELEADNAKLKEFAIEAFQVAFNGHDWCGDDIQDAGVMTGLLEQTEFDPDEHTTDCEFVEPGDTFYVFAALLKEKE